MKKLNKHGEVVQYPPDQEEPPTREDWEGYIRDFVVSGEPSTTPNLECGCGSKTFHVCWWDYPYTGGYCKVTCSVCGEELVLIDDFA